MVGRDLIVAIICVATGASAFLPGAAAGPITCDEYSSPWITLRADRELWFTDTLYESGAPSVVACGGHPGQPPPWDRRDDLSGHDCYTGTTLPSGSVLLFASLWSCAEPSHDGLPSVRAVLLHEGGDTGEQRLAAYASVGGWGTLPTALAADACVDPGSTPGGACQDGEMARAATASYLYTPFPHPLGFVTEGQQEHFESSDVDALEDGTNLSVEGLPATGIVPNRLAVDTTGAPSVHATPEEDPRSSCAFLRVVTETRFDTPCIPVTEA